VGHYEYEIAWTSTVWRRGRMPGWAPSTEVQIQDLIATGDLREHRGLDVKQEVGDTDSPRRETARDLASFAIDGGSLLIGVKEDKATGTFSVSPIRLAGGAERIEQIGVTRVEPPLFVQVRDIPSSQGEGIGYLWVEIPPSPQAPHMVDGKYWGRIDRTKGRLTDAQVVELHSQRQPVDDRVSALLQEEINRDPVPMADAREGHLYLVADPLSAPPSAALPFLRPRDPQSLTQLIIACEDQLGARTRDAEPTPSAAHALKVRAEGLAMTSLWRSGARALDESSPEASMLDIEFREDGGIRAVMGRMTDISRASQVICDGLAVAYSRRLLRWATAYGDAFGYSGQWAFGVAANRLAGLSSSVFQDYRLIGEPSIYDAESYRSTTSATTQELKAQPWEVAERLVGKLVRALTTDVFYAADLQAPSA
jgi:hypothetical protein